MLMILKGSGLLVRRMRDMPFTSFRNLRRRNTFLAAVLSQHGVLTIYTHDRDFRKFEFLNVRDPLGR